MTTVAPEPDNPFQDETALDKLQQCLKVNDPFKASFSALELDGEKEGTVYPYRDDIKSQYPELDEIYLALSNLLVQLLSCKLEKENASKPKVEDVSKTKESDEEIKNEEIEGQNNQQTKVTKPEETIPKSDGEVITGFTKALDENPKEETEELQMKEEKESDKIQVTVLNDVIKVEIDDCHISNTENPDEKPCTELVEKPAPDKQTSETCETVIDTAPSQQLPLPTPKKRPSPLPPRRKKQAPQPTSHVNSSPHRKPPPPPTKEQVQPSPKPRSKSMKVPPPRPKLPSPTFLKRVCTY